METLRTTRQGAACAAAKRETRDGARQRREPDECEKLNQDNCMWCYLARMCPLTATMALARPSHFLASEDAIARVYIACGLSLSLTTPVVRVLVLVL